MPRYIVPLIVACALFMETMDSTVIATSLPAIAADLGENPLALKLALTSYLLALAVFIPISGWAADKFGVRTVFRLAIVVFTVGSALCGFATSLGEFVAFRIVQGIGGAMMVPVGRLAILRTVPKSELVSALAWLTVPALMGPVVGPPLGGFITTFIDWRWIFWINIPIGILGLLLASRFMVEAREDDPPPLDLAGFAIVGSGLAALVFGLSTVGQDFIAAQAAVGLILAGIALLGIYVWYAQARADPILDLRLLRLESFFASVVGGFLFRLGIGATPFLLPLLFQLGFGMSAFQSGMLTCAGAVGALTMKFTAAPILRRFGFRPVLIANGVLASAFISAGAWFTPETPYAAIVAVLLFSGFFRSLQFTSLNALAFADVDQRRMSQATSLSSVAQQVALSTGVAVAALTIEATAQLSGHALTAEDFAPAFIMVALVALMAIPFYLRLPRDAGASLAGPVRTPPAPEAAKLKT
jgi:EmrB/QacA subfamily drug resistance transporter